MKKAQQQEMLELVKTLHEAHAEVKGSIEKRQNQIAQSILADCQECAISIGNAIEAFEGEGFITISFLEKYCQVLFQSHESLNEIKINEKKLYKNLEKQLIRIENSIKNDIPIRKEIAFFPYKASMWDSLESIYRAAKEDPDVDAYCVPIPYYDLKPDRSFGEMHYEGMEYPKNIEVIDWQTYNFEERKPDVIYIHNPYDNWNLVTSVHPRFYSDRLKAATEELVYVPYFVLQEIEPTNQTAIDGMKHFCYLPGIINADKVILQSENMAKIYANEYLKAAKANGLNRKHIDKVALEHKFLGLGSPKFDKVKNIKKEDLEIPEEWLKIIENPDGSWKKIIFYNTSIAALLEHNEKMLEKMKWVFNVFKENKDEVALLWRPHPLLKNTVSAMRPWLWTEYDKLVQQYRKECWGIYDDSADMDRAVVLSDAYYGDQSSVVQVYQQTGKPVMIQNANVQNDDNIDDGLCRINLSGVAICAGKIWCCVSDFKCLLSIDMKTQMRKYFEIPSDDLYSTAWAFGALAAVDGKLYLVPFMGKHMLLFDVEAECFKEIELDRTILGNMENAFMGVVEHKEYLFVLGAKEPVIMRMNTKTGKIEYITSWHENAINYVFNSEDAYFRRQAVIVNEKLYVPFCNANALLELDCNTLEVQLYQLGKECQGYSGVCKVGEELWLSPRKSGSAVIWDLNSHEVKEIPIKNENAGKGLTYAGIVDIKGKKYLLPVRKNEKSKYENASLVEMQGAYSVVCEQENTIILYDTSNGKAMLFDKNCDECAEIDVWIDEYIVDVERIMRERGNCVKEIEGMNLKNLTNLV